VINFTGLFERALENARLDLATLRYSFRSGFPVKPAYLAQKYDRILRGKRSIPWMGHPFAYDNRLTPALLQSYLEEIEFLKQYIPFSEMNTVLDLGANVGQFSRTLLGFYPHLKIWSMEPNPEIWSVLKRNAETFPDWKVIPRGVSKENKTSAFYFVPEKSAQGSLYSENASAKLLKTDLKKIHIECIALDSDAQAQWGMPSFFDLIKVDVEGAEYEALEGLRDIRCRYLYMEVSDGRSGARNFSDFQRLLKNQWGRDFRVVAERRDSKNQSCYDLILEFLAPDVNRA
jgi:FkbM family methyltransferase